MARPRLDAFTRAYIEAALWSSTDWSDESGGEPLDKNYSVGDIDDATLDKMIADCADFQERFGELIGSETEQAGHDFWLTRNGHGAGFWDGDWEEPAATELTEGSKEYGEFDLYIGDDGAIHGSPLEARSMRERGRRARPGRVREPSRGATYTVEAGRQIYRNGEPFISIGREGNTIPADADDATHQIAAELNRAGWEPKWASKKARRR